MAKSEGITPLGCLAALWALTALFVNVGLNATLWYMLLVHVQATPMLWAIYWVYIPVHLVVAMVTMLISVVSKAMGDQ